MILTVTLNVAVDSTWKVEDFNIGSIMRVKKDVPIRVAGGKGINVARVINRLGEDVLVTGFIGGDMGKYIVKKLKDEKLRHEFVNVNGESRECLIILDTKKKNMTVINGAGPEISSSEVDIFKIFFLNIISQCKVICLSGSLPLGVSKDIYADLITIANEKNVPVILDTSNEALRRGIIARPFMVKPTSKEAEEILHHNIQSDIDIIEATKYFLENGAKSVIISRGGKNAIVGTNTDLWTIIPPKVKVINPVGSGDAFVGGCAVAIARGLSILDAVKLGTAAGAANAEKLGTGDVTNDRVQELLNEVGWHRL